MYTHLEEVYKLAVSFESDLSAHIGFGKDEIGGCRRHQHPQEKCWLKDGELRSEPYSLFGLLIRDIVASRGGAENNPPLGHRPAEVPDEDGFRCAEEVGRHG